MFMYIYIIKLHLLQNMNRWVRKDNYNIKHITRYVHLMILRNIDKF